MVVTALRSLDLNFHTEKLRSEFAHTGAHRVTLLHVEAKPGLKTETQSACAATVRAVAQSAPCPTVPYRPPGDALHLYTSPGPRRRSRASSVLMLAMSWERCALRAAEAAEAGWPSSRMTYKS